MITLAAAGAMGIVVERIASPSPWLWVIVGLLGLIMQSRRSGLVRWSWLLLSVAATLGLRASTDEAGYRAASLLARVTSEPTPAVIEGRVTGLVQKNPRPAFGYRDRAKAWQTRFDVRVTAVRHRGEMVACDGGLAVTLDDDAGDAIRSGDRVRLRGRLVGLTPPTNPGVTDYTPMSRNLGRHGRLFVDRLPQVELLERPRFSIRAIADRLSRGGESTLRASLGEETGALAAALVVGRRQSILPETKDQLLETGTIHLLSVSGLHMGIVALVLNQIAVALGMRRLPQVIFVASLCLLFVAVTGARPPVIRAASLVAVVLLARVCDRQDSPLNSLGLAALVLLWNPTNLFQVGVQLSFVAVATLFSCGQRYDRLGEELRAEAQLERLMSTARSPLSRRLTQFRGHLSNALWFSLCVTLATTPLVWFHFHIVTPVAVVANVILGLPVAAGLISGLVAVTAGWFSIGLATPFAWLCQGSLWLVQAVVDFAADIPLGHLWLPSPPAAWVALYYLGAIAGFWLPVGWRRRRWFVGGTLLWCLVAWWLATAPSRQPPEDLRATFLDVGHGTSVILQLPDGRNLLYDCGSMTNHTYSGRGIQEPLWELGLTRLDAILLSHADADHVNALPGLLRRFRVGELVVPTGMLEVPKAGLIPIRQAIETAAVPVREISRETHYLDDRRSIEILHPPATWVAGSDNANSLVAVLHHGGRSLVLPGDLEPPGLEIVTNFPRPPVGGVLMAPHHGSLTLDNRLMLDWARPREVIVSGGARARRPEVEAVLRVRGSGVHVTAEQGAIRVTVSAEGIAIRGWRENRW